MSSSQVLLRHVRSRNLLHQRLLLRDVSVTTIYSSLTKMGVVVWVDLIRIVVTFDITNGFV